MEHTSIAAQVKFIAHRKRESLLLIHFSLTKGEADVVCWAGHFDVCDLLTSNSVTACEGLVWASLRGKEASQLAGSGVVPVCTELEDGLWWICFPLGIRAGTGLASVQLRY